jgi:parallel beta-helix repeat protein
MKKELFTMATIVLLFTISFSGCIEEKETTPVEPKTNLVVIEGKGNYTTIQEAIENASDGDTVFVYNGTYYENLAIAKSINLKGENKDTTIIIAKDNNVDIISIAQTTIVISGFTLMNASNGNGISITGSSNNIILNCSVSGNKQGIVFTRSNYNTITDCIISNNTGKGINIWGSSNNTINLCEVSNNDYGMYIWNMSYVIHEETGTSPVYYTNSTNNTISGNNFINNAKQAFDSSGCNNSWDDDGDGNYWDDYTGVDSDGDNIGDTPYLIDGGNSQDNYPLIYA